MKDRECKRHRKRIRRFIAKWDAVLGMRWWTVHHNYIVEGYKVNGEYAPDTAASTNVRWEYGEASVNWNMVRVADLDDAELEKVVIHEFCHVLVNETRQTGKDWLMHEERVVSHLAAAFVWVRATGTVK